MVDPCPDLACLSTRTLNHVRRDTSELCSRVGQRQMAALEGDPDFPEDPLDRQPLSDLAYRRRLPVLEQGEEAGFVVGRPNILHWRPSGVNFDPPRAPILGELSLSQPSPEFLAFVGHDDVPAFDEDLTVLVVGNQPAPWSPFRLPWDFPSTRRRCGWTGRSLLRRDPFGTGPPPPAVFGKLGGSWR